MFDARRHSGSHPGVVSCGRRRPKWCGRDASPVGRRSARSWRRCSAQKPVAPVPVAQFQAAHILPLARKDDVDELAPFTLELPLSFVFYSR